MWLLRNYRKTHIFSVSYKTYQTIAESYQGQSVFMTGGTGFIGKVIIEKLLYSCPGIDNIYLLVRDKKGVIAQQRIHQMLEQPLFSRLKEERPRALEKIIPIVGDIAVPQLGLKPEDEELLTDKISTVFHIGATVKFNDPLKEVINVNVTGTERILNLSKRMKKVKAFVYVSTAYSNVDKKVIEEILYPAPVPLDEVNQLLAVGITEEQTKQLIKSRPNTYTFTKVLAENLVADNHGSIPTVIIRPSTVGASVKEPMAGWVDTAHGATALMATIMKGHNRIILAKSDNILDIIPVDYVINLMIVAAARCKCSKQVNIYHSSTSCENPATIKQIMGPCAVYGYKHKFYDVPMPMIFFTPFKWVLLTITPLIQTLPACIADAFLLIRGKKTRYMKSQAKAIHTRNIVEYFTMNDWVVSASKTRGLYKSLSPSDRSTFPCDPADVNWDEYLRIYCQGIRQYLYGTS